MRNDVVEHPTDMLISNGNAYCVIQDFMREHMHGYAVAYGFSYRLICAGEQQKAMEGRVRVSDDGYRSEIESVYVNVPYEFMNEELSNAPADVYQFVGTMIAVAHEAQHVFQYVGCSGELDRIDKIIRINQFATQENAVYYLTNYNRSPAEIDAQAVAILDTYDTLTEMFGKECAEKYILDYQEVRHQKMMDFIPKPESGRYESVDAILTAYDSAFEQSVHMRRLYDKEPALAYGDAAGRIFEREPSCWRKFNAEKDGLEQEKMVALTYFVTEPRVKYRLPELTDEIGEELSMPVVFRDSALKRFLKGVPERKPLGYSVHNRNDRQQERLHELDAWVNQITGHDVRNDTEHEPP